MNLSLKRPFEGDNLKESTYSRGTALCLKHIWMIKMWFGPRYEYWGGVIEILALFTWSTDSLAGLQSQDGDFLPPWELPTEENNIPLCWKEYVV